MLRSGLHPRPGPSSGDNMVTDLSFFDVQQHDDEEECPHHLADSVGGYGVGDVDETLDDGAVPPLAGESSDEDEFVEARHDEWGYSDWYGSRGRQGLSRGQYEGVFGAEMVHDSVYNRPPLLKTIKKMCVPRLHLRTNGRYRLMSQLPWFDT